MSEEETVSEGDQLLNAAWFSAIRELGAITENSEDPRARVEAADTLLRYFISLGQSINEPWIPVKEYDFENDEEGDDDE